MRYVKIPQNASEDDIRVLFSHVVLSTVQDKVSGWVRERKVTDGSEGWSRREEQVDQMRNRQLAGELEIMIRWVRWWVRGRYVFSRCVIVWASYRE